MVNAVSVRSAHVEQTLLTTRGIGGNVSERGTIVIPIQTPTAVARHDHHGRHEGSHHPHHHDEVSHPTRSVDQVAFSATVHCLAGCAIGEVLGMVIGTALGWGNWPTVALAVGLAFTSGYLFTLLPLLRSGLDVGTAGQAGIESALPYRPRAGFLRASDRRAF